MPLRQEDLEKAHLVKAIIEKEFYKPLTVDSLVDRVNTNKFKLKIAFKLITGYTVHEYLTKVRMDNAKDLLENTELTVEQIAYKIGLDKSNLDKQFKKLTMKTPTEWRKLLPRPGIQNTIQNPS